MGGVCGVMENGFCGMLLGGVLRVWGIGGQVFRMGRINGNGVGC